MSNTAEVQVVARHARSRRHRWRAYLNPLTVLSAYLRFLKRTVREFGLPEVIGTVAAVGAGYLAHRWGDGAWGGWAAATAGAMGETVGFYGTSFVQRFRELRRDPDGRYSRRDAAVEAGRYLLSTFTIAEIVDTPVRSSAMWAVPAALNASGLSVGTSIGLLGGKIVADHVYFAIAIPSSDAYRRRAARREAARKMHGR